MSKMTHWSHNTGQMYDYCVVLHGNEGGLRINKTVCDCDISDIRLGIRCSPLGDTFCCNIARVFAKDALEAARKYAKEQFGENYLIVYNNRCIKWVFITR